jgi:hypothetical protein
MYSISRSFNKNQEPLPISTFDKSDKFIKQQLTDVKNENIEGIKCLIKGSTITYQDSEYDKFADYIKDYYYISPFSSLNAFSFTKAFQDTEESFFLPTLLTLSDRPILWNIQQKMNMIYLEVEKIDSQKNLSANEKDKAKKNIYSKMSKLDQEEEDFMRISNLPDFTKSLFNGEYDNQIDDMKLYPHGYVNDFASIDINIKAGKKVCTLIKVQRSSRQTHIVAGVFWYKDGKITCILYDPIYNSRDEKNPSKNYLWALNLIYYNLKLTYRGAPINIINISLKYCVIKEGKGVRCPQYYINAEYCSMFSLYFLFCYARNGYPDTEEGLKRTIDDAYIVNPSELKREPCVASNKFRLVFMSFFLTVLTVISNDQDVLESIKKKYDTMKPSYRILEDSILLLLENKIKKVSIPPPAGSPGSKGGQRQTRKRQTRKKQTRKQLKSSAAF